MYWILETNNEDYGADSLKQLINKVVNSATEDQHPVYITNMYVIFDNDYQRFLSNKLIIKLQDYIDERYEELLEIIEQEKKAQKELEKEYWEGRL